MRAGWRKPGEIDAGLGGEPARERAHGDAACEPRRAVIAFGRADRAKRIERDRRKGAVLSARGLSVVRATDTQLDEEPLAVVVRVAQTLAHAA